MDELYQCWRWAGELYRDGYAAQRVNGLKRLAHRIVYEAERGPIPDGMVLDHLCRRRDCVNPDHIEPVTKRENQKRKAWRYRVRRQTHCPRGHLLKHNALRTREGGFVCRECQ